MTQPAPTQVTVGVDTHADVHVAVATDSFGRRLDTTSVPTTRAGYAGLLAWARGLGHPNAWGIEGTGSFGAGLTRFLRSRGQVVVEVNRPDRAARRRRGKSDPLDAEAVQAQQGSAPKAGDGQVEMIRSLRVARATAMKARTQAINALKGLLITAPAELREQLRGRSTVRLLQATATLEPGPVTTPLAAAKLGLRTLARRYQALSAQLAVLDAELDRLNRAAAPSWWRCLGRVRLGRGAAGGCRGQPRSAALRGGVCDAVRGLADSGVLGQDPPASAESGWRPPGQRGAASDRGGPAAPRPTHHGLPGPPPSRGQVQEGSHPLLEALRGSGGIRGPITMSAGARWRHCARGDQSDGGRGHSATGMGDSSTPTILDIYQPLKPVAERPIGHDSGREIEDFGD